MTVTLEGAKVMSSQQALLSGQFVAKVVMLGRLIVFASEQAVEKACSKPGGMLLRTSNSGAAGRALTLS